jgi:hypothetical protein
MTKIPLSKESIIYLLFLGLITIILYIFLPILAIITFILFLFIHFNKGDIVRCGLTVIGVIK